MRPTSAAALVVTLSLVAVACTGGTYRGAQPTTTTTAGAPTTTIVIPPSTASATYACAMNTATEAVTGVYGSASAIGWTGNAQGVVTCLGGWFYPQGRFNKAFGFGIYDGGPTTWVSAQGYLPAQITSFRRTGADIAITEFADQVLVGAHPYVAVYARVAVTNTTDQDMIADPEPSSGLVPLSTAADELGPHATAAHDYVLAVDQFNHAYPWPSDQALAAAGGFDAHFQHMRTFWLGRLSQIAAVDVPDRQLDDAYRSGFIYTEIARSGAHENTGVNNYQSEFSHDVIGILTNLFTQGSYADAHTLLLDARDVVGAQGQYEDGIWTYSWPWAVYLLKTGDIDFVRANFSTPGPGPSTEPSIEQTAHRIAADRTGPNGIIGLTDDIDSNGYWTVDDYEALLGLAAYRYLARKVGDTGEAQWATTEYQSLLSATNQTLTATVRRYGLTYLPCSMVQPNTANRCNEPRDANWAAPFLFGRWAWDAFLLGAPLNGPGLDLIDATYAYGFGRLAGALPPQTYGGYPPDYYTTAYNAGYGSWGLAGSRYRTEGILGYQFMVANGQSGPYSWWESSTAPSTVSPWAGNHPAGGQGASPHAWGIANANKVLLDSLAAQESDGTLIVGRGVPAAWVTPGRTISVTNFPTSNGGRVSISISSGKRSVTLTVSGSAPSAVDFELPSFVDDISSATSGTILQTTGTVHISAPVKTVTVRLLHS